MGGGVGFWKTGHQNAPKTPENADTRAESNISSFRLLPWASVFFRDRSAAVVSLDSDIYPIDGVGKCGGGRILENWKPQGAKNA